MKISKLVLATDFSKFSEKATAYAQALKKQLDADLTIIHVFDENFIETFAPYFAIPEDVDWLGDSINKSKKRALSTLEKISQKLGKKSTHGFIVGSPAVEIVKYTENNQVDLLIMGTHGYSGIKRFVMGSIAQYVVAHAKCPVTVVKADN